MSVARTREASGPAATGMTGMTRGDGAAPVNAMASAAVERKLQAVRGLLRDLGGVVVACSGGVDSTLLAYVAHEVLGGRALACTASSPAVPSDEVEEARAIAARFGIRHRVVVTDELEQQDYTRNTPNRCYVCKGVVFGRLLEVAREEGLPYLVYGANVDDGADYRPGAVAAAELGARAPLAEAGLTKAEIRELARAFGLPTADKPAQPCLSSRIPYGQPVTVEKLQRIEAAERALRALGFDEVRVRHHGPVARIEVPAGRLAELLGSGTREQVVAALRGAGFAYVALDLEGLRSGSLNEPLLGRRGDRTAQGRAAAGGHAAVEVR